MNIMGGVLFGTDGYTRLNRVQFIYEQGAWNDSIYPRSNAPYGESIHWTKPMDLILLAGGIGLSVFVPFSTGLHVWGSSSVLCYIFCCFCGAIVFDVSTIRSTRHNTFGQSVPIATYPYWLFYRRPP